MSAARTFAAMLSLAALQVRADWCLHAGLNYPGASVSTMAERVMPVVERGLRTVPGVRSIRTVLLPERMRMVIRLDGPESVGNRRLVRLDLLSRFNDLRHDLPDGMEDLSVEDVYLRTYSLVCSVSGEGTSMRELKLRAREVMDELLRVPDVSDARLFGAEQEAVVLSLSKNILDCQYSIGDLGPLLTGTFELEPAGAIDIGSRHVRIRSQSSVFSADNILDLPFTVFPENADPITCMLRDYMKVSIERNGTPPEAMTGVDGRRCVLLAVAFDRPPKDARVDEILARAKADAPLGVEFEVVHDRREASAEPMMAFDLRLQEGVRIERMDNLARAFAQQLKGIPGVKRALTLTGDVNILLERNQVLNPSAPNHTMLVLELEGKTDRALVGHRVSEALEKGHWGLQVWPRQPDLPGFGERVEMTVTSSDPQWIERITAQMVEAARTTPGVETAVCDWGEPIESVRFELYESRARQLALTQRDISTACRMAIEGIRISSCWDRGDLLPVVLRISHDDMSSLQDLRTMWAYSPHDNRFVPFSQIVSSFHPISEPGCRIRENGRYEARVMARAQDAATRREVVSEWDRIRAAEAR